MALSFKKLREQARKALMIRRTGPKNDIQRDNIDEDSGRSTGYHLNSLVNDIKKNWADIKTLNKKF
jgi:hypothetical protein